MLAARSGVSLYVLARLGGLANSITPVLSAHHPPFIPARINSKHLHVEDRVGVLVPGSVVGGRSVALTDDGRLGAFVSVSVASFVLAFFPFLCVDRY